MSICVRSNHTVFTHTPNKQRKQCETPILATDRTTEQKYGYQMIALAMLHNHEIRYKYKTDFLVFEY